MFETFFGFKKTPFAGAPLFADAAATAYFRDVQADAAGSAIEFRGWEEDAGAALAELDLLAVPSWGPEATTRVILEAWAAGVPVLASRVGGIAEIVDDGETGFLVEQTPPRRSPPGSEKFSRYPLSGCDPWLKLPGQLTRNGSRWRTITIKS